MPDFAGGSPTLFDAYINLTYLPRGAAPDRQVQGADRARAAPVRDGEHVRRARPADLPGAHPRPRGPGLERPARRPGELRDRRLQRRARQRQRRRQRHRQQRSARTSRRASSRSPSWRRTGSRCAASASASAFSYGNENQAAPSFRLAYDNGNFFAYRGATTGAGALPAVTADGAHLRLAPQGTWYWGPFGLLWECDALASAPRTRRRQPRRAPRTRPGRSRPATCSRARTRPSRASSRARTSRSARQRLGRLRGRRPLRPASHRRRRLPVLRRSRRSRARHRPVDRRRQLVPEPLAPDHAQLRDQHVRRRRDAGRHGRGPRTASACS